MVSVVKIAGKMLYENSYQREKKYDENAKREECD